MTTPQKRVRMEENACKCTESPTQADPEPDTDRTTERLLNDDDVLEAPLPDDLQMALGAFLGEDAVETLGDWAAVVRRRTGGGSISIDDLCHSDVETPHWGEIAEETYYFKCFYDAVLLASLAKIPVDIRTESPRGTVIEAHANGRGELRVSPSSAVFSFGIDTAAADESDGDPTLGDMYSANCPFVRAFPDRDAYEQWAETVPAATAALPLDGATEMATAMTD